MLNLSEIVSEAIGTQDIEITIPFVRDIINKLETETKSLISNILSNTDKERIIEQIDIESKSGNIDHALVIANKLLNSILNKLYSSYPFQLNDIKHEDHNEVVRLKRKINKLLTYKAHKLFNSGKKKEAYKLLNDQRDYLNETRYEGYKSDIYDWKIVEDKWNKTTDEQEINEGLYNQALLKQNSINSQNVGQNHYIGGKVQQYPELDELEKGRAENNSEIIRYNAMLTLGQIENAINLCLDRLIFFSGIESDLIYSPLLLANSVYIKEWEDLLGSLIETKNPINISNPNELIEKIYHIIDKPLLDDIRLELTKLLFKLES